MNNALYHTLSQRKQKNCKSFAVLIDPDKTDKQQCQRLIHEVKQHPVDFFFLGGSLVTSSHQEQLISLLKASCPDIPIVLFPGHAMQINESADALLFLSLVSGRNPELLIGQHVQVASRLKASKLEVIPTAYLLIDPGHPTSVSYMSQTMPIPHDKPSIACSTAVAAELMGMKLTYLDAGSGAQRAVPASVIREVNAAIDGPLVVGGGINTLEKAITALNAGADLIVIGNAIEKNPDLIAGVSELIYTYNRPLDVH